MLVLAVTAPAAAAPLRPHIVYIRSDDQGWRDAGFHGLDGVDLWPTLSEGKPSPRHEVVYGIEPFRAAVREDDWKLVWKATLPSKLELFDLATDPEEARDLAATHPAIVARLQRKAEAEARNAVQPLIFSESLGVVKSSLFGAVVFPEGAQAAAPAH